MHFPPDRSAHTTAFDEPVVDHWLEQKNSPNCKCFCHARSIRHAWESKPLHPSALLPELRPAPSATSKVILGLVLTCDSLHSWLLYSALTWPGFKPGSSNHMTYQPGGVWTLDSFGHLVIFAKLVQRRHLLARWRTKPPSQQGENKCIAYTSSCHIT